MYTPKQFESLPKWAQHEIQRLAANESHLAEKIRAMGSDESRIAVDNSWDQPALHLPEHSRVQFMVGENRQDYISVGFEYRRNEPSNVLRIQAGGLNLAFIPQAANVGLVTLLK